MLCLQTVKFCLLDAFNFGCILLGAQQKNFSENALKRRHNPSCVSHILARIFSIFSFNRFCKINSGWSDQITWAGRLS